ncbi:odorant receptor Or2-like [Pogonomyrmex barbatus]|uniref:Odorant receptor Or2-like n=1 Tax=Pogonomyrmex barbatus TaxID=144034 RepID=A0A6I9X1X0_9HYME|nr:odorant receptor Or2-like [Pogonomyrmex barbatus]
MHTLPLSFALLTYTGYWRPIGLTSIKYWAYIVYSIIMNFLLYSYAFCGLVDCFIFKDLETFIEKFSLCVSVVSVSFKVLNLVVNRDKIVSLTDMLLDKVCIPRNDHEMNIRRRFDHNAKCIKAKERQLIREFIYHHRYVYRLAERVNTVFTVMIFMQFTVSSIVLCLTIYKMLMKNLLSAEFVWISTYLGCMLGQIFLYCWFSNEVTLKSTEVGNAVYEMDWTMLPNELMKSLLVIIIRSKKPIVITSGHIVTLSNESFMKVIKVSYSAFNVLQGS